MNRAKSLTSIAEIMLAHVFVNCGQPAILQTPVHAGSPSLYDLQLLDMQGLLQHPQSQSNMRLHAEARRRRLEITIKLCTFLVFLTVLMWFC